VERGREELFYISSDARYGPPSNDRGQFRCQHASCTFPSDSSAAIPIYDLFVYDVSETGSDSYQYGIEAAGSAPMSIVLTGQRS